VSLVRFSVGADPELLDALSDCLLSAGAGALEEGPGVLHAYADSEELIQALTLAVEDFRERVAVALPGLRVDEPELSPVAEDWQRAWLDRLVPERLTGTLWARPTHRAPAPPGQRTIWLEPSAAFGEGGHASTRLAARAIERLSLERPGSSLLDVGTGTGVLLFVALECGAERALGIDVDPIAVRAAKTNAALNGYDERCQVSDQPLQGVLGTFDLVVANMIVPSLRELAPNLLAKLASGGRLVLSGLLLEDATDLAAYFSRLGAREVQRQADGDWCALELESASA